MHEFEARLNRMSRQMHTWRIASILSIACAAAMILTGAAKEQQLTQDSLILRSPDGKCTIMLKAADLNNASGMWVDRGKEAPMISVVNGPEGCAYGIFRQNSAAGTNNGFDAAIGVDKTGGYVQMFEGADRAQFKTNKGAGERITLHARDLMKTPQ